MELDFFPEVDMFASCLNNKCEKYFSYSPDPYSMGVDSFLTSWSSGKLYLFPPLNCCSHVVCKLLADQATALVALPDWPEQAWAPTGTRHGKQRQNKFSNILWSAHANLATLEYWGTSGELLEPETAFCYYFQIAVTEHMGWSHVSVDHMLRHFQHSTRATYSAGINWWVDFCNEYKLNIFFLKIKSLEIFFIMLFGTTKLLGSTIPDLQDCNKLPFPT